jgi:hypothetical protein
LDLLDQPVLQAHLDPLVNLDLQDLQGLQGHLDLKAQEVKQAHLGQLVLLDQVERLEVQDPVVQEAKMVQLDCQDHQDLKEKRDRKEQKDLEDQMGHPDQLETLALKGPQVQVVCKGNLGHQDSKVQEVLLVQLA